MTPTRDARLGAVGIGFVTTVTVVTTVVRALDGGLLRDASVYAYAGQQVVAGTPPYESIVDPKGPLSALVPGLGVGLGRLFGVTDLDGVRVVLAVALLGAVLGIYALAFAVTQSVLAAVAAALASLSASAWSRSAWEGPEVKVLATAFAVWCLWALASNRWLAAGALAGLAGATWQPLALCLLAAMVVVVLRSEERRDVVRRLALGVAAPALALLGYLGVTGALPEAYAYAVRFPFTGIAHRERGPVERLEAVATSIDNHFGAGGAVTVLGLLVLVVAAVVRWRRGDRAHPLVAVVVPAALVLVVYTAVDYQGYADLLPLVPFGCLGVAVLVAGARSTALRMVAGVATAVLVAVALGSAASASGADLAQQRRSACALDALVGDGELLAMGDPTPLVLTGRTNHDRFVYIGSGIGALRIDQTPGGLGGWHDEVLARRPRAVVIMGLETTVTSTFKVQLRRHGYAKVFLGPWRVYLDRQAPRGAGVVATEDPTRLAVVDDAVLRECGL